MRILAVEDDAVSLKLITSILTKAGYDVLSATTGEEAIAVLERAGPIDIIVTDISMPVMNGFHLLAYLKAEPRLQRIPVILCSALSDANVVKKGVALGAVDFLTKPVEAEVLIKKVKKAEARVPGAVLVVDDEKLLCDLLTRILEREGLRVLTATDGREALGVLDRDRITVVLSDIVMPRMDGMELLAQTRIRFPDLPVLLVTGHTERYRLKDVLSAGGQGLVTKPFKNSEIMSQIRPFVD